MTKKKDLIAKIVEIEWRMFTSVHNVDGRASCQDDYGTFAINRTSQGMSWSEAALESYLADLAKAEADGRNLCTEKYARMMESTAPEEYAALADSLPSIDQCAPMVIDMIVYTVLEWEEALEVKYPAIFAGKRPLRSSNDTPFVTSLETYLRGELATYSIETLQLYCEHVLQQKAEGKNGSEVTLFETVKRYGYESLERANECMRSRG